MAINSWRDGIPAPRRKQRRPQKPPPFYYQFPEEQFEAFKENQEALVAKLESLRGEMSPEGRKQSTELISAAQKAAENRMNSGQQAKVK